MQIYRLETQDYQTHEKEVDPVSYDIDYHHLAETIFEEIGFSVIGLRNFDDSDEMLQELARTNNHLSFGYTYFDFNLSFRERNNELSKVAFSSTLNSTIISSDGVENFGNDLQVVIEHEGMLHYAYFFSGTGVIRAVIPYRHRRDPELRFDELEPALLVIVDTHLTRSDVNYLVSFDGYGTEILRMLPEAIEIPQLR